MEQPTLNPESGFLRFRIDFSYDGSAFSGWAKQPDQRTIQGEMDFFVSTSTIKRSKSVRCSTRVASTL